MGQVDETGGEDLRTRVFLSYSRKDGEVMARVAEGLLAAGFLADFDKASHDPHNVTSGISAEDEWWKRLQEMIAAADVMVFLVSPDSATSQVCDEEIAYARALGKRIIAVLARPVDFAKAPPRLSALNVSIDFTEGGRGFDAAMAGLVSALEMNVGWHREGRKYYARVQEWDTRGRPRSLLLREGAVEDAERWALARPRNEPEPGELFLAWVEASRAQIKRDAARRAFWRRVTAVFVLTTLVATLAGAWFVVSGQRDLGRSESLMLARTSERFYNQGDHMRALHLAILASRGSFLSPTTDEARAAFAKSAQALKHLVSVRQEAKPGIAGDPAMVAAVDGFQTSPDGRRLATWDPYGWVTLWDTATGTRVGEPFRLEWGVGYNAGEFNADSSRFLTWDQAGAQLFDAETGAALLGAEGERSVSDEGVFRRAYFAAGGSRVVTIHGKGQIRLWDAATAEPVAELQGDVGEGFGRVSEDGSIVYGWTNTEVRFWDAATGAAKGAPIPLAQRFWHAALSPDNQLLVSWGPDADVTLRRVTDGSQVSMTGCHTEDASNVRFLPETGRMVTRASGGQVCIWDMETGRQVGERLSHAFDDSGLVISPDGRMIYTRTYLTGGRLTFLETGDAIEAPEDDAGAVRGRFSPDSKYLVTQTYTETRLWHAGTYESAGLSKIETPSYEALFSPDGRYLGVFGEDKVQLFDIIGGGSTSGALPHTNYNDPPAFLPDGRIVTVANNTASIWQVRDWTASGPELPEWGFYYGVMMSPDGTRVLTWDEEGFGMLWDVRTDSRIGGALLLGEQGFWDVVFDTARPQLALRYEDVVQIVSTETGAGGEAVMEHPAYVNWMEFVAGGTRLLTMADDGFVRLWDTGSAALLAEIDSGGEGFPPEVSPTRDRFVVWEGLAAGLRETEGGGQIGAPLASEAPPENEEFPGGMYDAKFSADGSVMVTTGAGEVRAWNAADGTPIGPALSTIAGEPVLAVSGDGALMLVNSGLAEEHLAGLDMPDGQGEPAVFLIDVASGAVKGPGLVHMRDVMGAVFSEDGRTLLTWTMDARGQLWDVETGQPKGDPMQLVSDSNSARFFDGDRRVLVWDQAGSQMLFDAATGAEVARNPQFDFFGTPVLHTDSGLMQTIDTNGRVRMWDIRYALRTGASADDIADVCAQKLNGPAGASGAAFVRELDTRSVFEAPILRGREGEDVCTAPAVPWWETAAGAVFGWAFQ